MYKSYTHFCETLETGVKIKITIGLGNLSLQQNKVIFFHNYYGPYSRTMFNANHWLNRTLNARKNERNSQSMNVV